jgi:NitT/TauT family transport system substrate-binding protein
MEALMVGGAVGLLGLGSEAAAADPPPETARLRLYKFPGICLAPQYVADALLRAEGFADLKYLESPTGVYDSVSSGAVDITQWYVAPFIVAADKGAPIVFLSGVHVGCLELVATGRIRTIRELKGKTIAAPFGTNSTVFALLGHIGLDYRKDVNFVEKTPSEALTLLAEEKIDAYLATAPFAQELRAKKIGHVIVNTNTDRPWSQYFCCMLVANQEFARKHPVAAKRALRAIIKAEQICALEPELVAREMVAQGFTKNYDYALQAMRDIPYGRWRQFDPEDSLRFYALRLHEAKVINLTPQKLIAAHADWRFLNDLKKELKI